jgi:hypothetical protein
MTVAWSLFHPQVPQWRLRSGIWKCDTGRWLPAFRGQRHPLCLEVLVPESRHPMLSFCFLSVVDHLLVWNIRCPVCKNTVCSHNHRSPRGRRVRWGRQCKRFLFAFAFALVGCTNMIAFLVSCTFGNGEWSELSHCKQTRLLSLPLVQGKRSSFRWSWCRKVLVKASSCYVSTGMLVLWEWARMILEFNWGLVPSMWRLFAHRACPNVSSVVSRTWFHELSRIVHNRPLSPP